MLTDPFTWMINGKRKDKSEIISLYLQPTMTLISRDLTRKAESTNFCTSLRRVAFLSLLNKFKKSIKALRMKRNLWNMFKSPESMFLSRYTRKRQIYAHLMFPPDPSQARVTLPYIQNVTEIASKLLQPHGIKRRTHVRKKNKFLFGK